MNDKDAQQEMAKVWAEACNRLAQAFKQFGASMQQASIALDRLNQTLSDNDWPEVVYEDILDAEIVEC